MSSYDALDGIFLQAGRGLLQGFVRLWPVFVLIGAIGIVTWLSRSGWGYDLRNRRLISKARTLADIKRMDWVAFEHLCRMLFEGQGYRVCTTSPRNDGGLDIVGSRDGRKIVAQCKKWTRKPVGRPLVSQLYGDMMHRGADQAFLITTSSFTPQARQFVQNKPIALIGPELLGQWINEYAAGRLESSEDAA